MLLHGKALTHISGQLVTRKEPMYQHSQLAVSAAYAGSTPMQCSIPLRYHTSCTSIAALCLLSCTKYCSLIFDVKGQQVELAYQLAAVYCIAHPRSTIRPCLSHGRVVRSTCAASAAKAGVGATSTGRAGPMKEPRCTSRYSRPAGTSPGSATCSRPDLSY